MPRTMTLAMATAFQQPVIRMQLFAALEFADSTAYMWTGLGDKVWSGMTFKGVGNLADVGAISEDSNVEAKGVTVSLSGIPSGLVGEVLNEMRVLGDARIWLPLYDAAGVLIPDPFLSYRGKMDAPELEDGGKTCTCRIALENILVDLNRECYRRYTDEDQQMDLADTLTRLGLPADTVDTGFSHVAGLQEQITFWGRNPSSVNNV